MVDNKRLIASLEAGIPLEETNDSPSSCTVDSIVRWQHDDTGRICELPKGKHPGRRWYKIKPANKEMSVKAPNA